MLLVASETESTPWIMLLSLPKKSIIFDEMAMAKTLLRGLNGANRERRVDYPDHAADRGSIIESKSFGYCGFCNRRRINHCSRIWSRTALILHFMRKSSSSSFFFVLNNSLSLSLFLSSCAKLLPFQEFLLNARIQRYVRISWLSATVQNFRGLLQSSPTVCRRLFTFSSPVFDSPHLHVSFDVALLTTSPLLLRALKLSTRRRVCPSTQVASVFVSCASSARLESLLRRQCLCGFWRGIASFRIIKTVSTLAAHARARIRADAITSRIATFRY